MPKPTYEPLSIRIHADRSGPEPPPGEPWPMAGVSFGDRDTKSAPPRRALVATSQLATWRDRGVLSTEGSRIVLRSGGPTDNPWKVDPVRGIPHMFEHLDRVIFHTLDGDVVYDVVENPDKWPAEKLDDTQETGFGGEVRWYYDLKLAGEAAA